MIDVDFGLRAGDCIVGADCDFFGGEAAQFRIVVTIGLELRQGQRAVVQDDRGRIVRRQQRLEFGFVAAKAAMQSRKSLG